MNNSNSNTEAVRQAVQQYIDGSHAGDVEVLKNIFHPKALMSGYLQGNVMIGPPDPFFEAVENNPSPAESGEPYSGEITSIEVSGNAASVTLKEKGFMGMNFTDYFHLLKEDGRWRIISKTFDQE